MNFTIVPKNSSEASEHLKSSTEVFLFTGIHGETQHKKGYLLPVLRAQIFSEDDSVANQS